jgi:hypothetical protein
MTSKSLTFPLGGAATCPTCPRFEIFSLCQEPRTQYGTSSTAVMLGLSEKILCRRVAQGVEVSGAEMLASIVMKWTSPLRYRFLVYFRMLRDIYKLFLDIFLDLKKYKYFLT